MLALSPSATAEVAFTRQFEPGAIPYINRFIGVVAGDAPIHKAFRAFSLENAAGIWRDRQAFFWWARGSVASAENEIGRGEWRKDRPAIPRHVRYEERDVCDLRSLHDTLRSLAADSHRAIINGRLREVLRRDPIAEHRKQKTNYEDVPSVWMIIDVDGAAISGVGSHFAIEELLSDAAVFEHFCDVFIGRALPPWLSDSTYIAVQTSSAGFASPDALSFRLIFQLAEPLSWKHRKAVALRLDAFAREAGFTPPEGKKALIDGSIYDPARIIFTADPRVVAKIEEGAVVRTIVATAPRLQIFVEREHDTIVVPAETLESEEPRASKARRSPALISFQEDPLSLLADGNTNEVILSFIAIYCARTPSHLWNAYDVCAAIQAAFVRQGLDACKDDRSRFLDIEWIERDFERLRPKLIGARQAATHAQPELRPPNEVRAELGKVLVDEIQRGIEGGTPSAVLIRAAPGTGKNHAYHNALTAKLLQSSRIFYYGPTVGLGSENVSRHAAILGAEHAPMVRQRVGRARLCKDRESGAVAEQAERASLSPLELVCPHCPLFETCAYPAQWRDTGHGLVVHQHQHAATSSRKIHPESDTSPHMTIVDEGYLGTALPGEKSSARPVLDLQPVGTYGSVVRRRRRKLDLAAITTVRLWESADLVAYRGGLTRVLAGSGPIRRDELDWFAYREGGLSRAKQAMETETSHQRWLHSELRSAMNLRRQSTAKQKRQIDKQIEEISEAYLVSRFAHSLLHAIETNLNIAGREEILGIGRFAGKDGERWVRCSLRAPLPRIMLERPTIWLDGTADPALLKVLYGRSNVPLRVYDWPIKPGAYHLTQYVDRTGSKKMMLEAKGAYSSSNIRRLHSFIHAKAREYASASRAHGCIVREIRKDVLVICQLPVRKKLEELGLPENVALEHFNAIRGIDTYREVPCGIFIGRPEPKDTVSEAMTEALFYDDPKVIALTRMSDWRAKHGRERFRRERQVQMADGTSMTFPCEGHPDEHVEAVRQQIVNAEVRQAVLRMRPYDRTDANPAEMHVFGDVDVGLPVHRLKRWIDAEVGPIEAMMAGGIVFTSARAARIALPEMFSGKSVRTVEMTLQRDLPVYMGKLRNWSQIEFRFASATADGRASYKQMAYVSPNIADAGAAVARQIGQEISWRTGEGEWTNSTPRDGETE